MLQRFLGSTSIPPSGRILDYRVSVEAAKRTANLNEALLCEVHTAAILTATLTSGINSFNDQALDIGPGALKPFVPEDMAALDRLKSLLLETDLSVDDLIFLTEFQAGVTAGRVTIGNYFNDAETIGQHRAAVVHRHTLELAWRQNCRLAILALRELDAHVAPELPELYVQNSRVLVALLAGASNGWRPCIDADGQLYLPPLPQQRRWPRRALLQNCRISFRNQTAEVFVRDLSAGGLGLDRAPPMIRGELVTVDLENGRKLRGIVAWSSGPSVGVRFLATLKPADPLLVV